MKIVIVQPSFQFVEKSASDTIHASRCWLEEVSAIPGGIVLPCV